MTYMKRQNQAVQAHIPRLSPPASFTPYDCHNLKSTLGDLGQNAVLRQRHSVLLQCSQALLNDDSNE